MAVAHRRQLGLHPFQVDLELVLLRRQPVLTHRPFLRLLPGLAGQVGVQCLQLVVVLLDRSHPGLGLLHLVLELAFLLGDGAFARLPVPFQAADLGQQRRLFVRQLLSLLLQPCGVFQLLARVIELGLEQLAVALDLRILGLRLLLQATQVSDQALPLDLPLVAGRPQRLDLGGQELHLAGQVGQLRRHPGVPLAEPVALFEQAFPVHGPLQLVGLQGLQVLAQGGVLLPQLPLVGFRLLTELDPFFFQLAELRPALVVARLGQLDLLLYPDQLGLGGRIGGLEHLVPLLQGFVLAKHCRIRALERRVSLLQGFVLGQQCLAVHGPPQLGAGQLIQVLLHLGQALRRLGELGLSRGQLRLHVLLQDLEVGNELRVLLQDLGEGLGGPGGVGHAALTRPCCRKPSSSACSPSRMWRTLVIRSIDCCCSMSRRRLRSRRSVSRRCSSVRRSVSRAAARSTPASSRLNSAFMLSWATLSSVCCFFRVSSSSVRAWRAVAHSSLSWRSPVNSLVACSRRLRVWARSSCLAASCASADSWSACRWLMNCWFCSRISWKEPGFCRSLTPTSTVLGADSAGLRRPTVPDRRAWGCTHRIPPPGSSPGPPPWRGPSGPPPPPPPGEASPGSCG